MELTAVISAVGGLCGAFTTIIAFIVLLFKPIRSKFVAWVGKTADTENINKKIDKLTGLVEKSIDQNTKLEKDIDSLRGDIDDLRKGLQSSLRNSILNLYYKCMSRGSITMFEKQNLMEMYASYVGLKGDQFITSCYEACCALPIKD